MFNDHKETRPGEITAPNNARLARQVAATDRLGRPRVRSGFTILEVLLVVLILGVIGALAVPQYTQHKERLKITQAKLDISSMEPLIAQYVLENRAYPVTLADIGRAGLLDPWNNPYQYLDVSNIKLTKGQARKDKNLVPINSDYDLYSMGPDGESVAPLTASKSRDDIVRANNGRYIGPASEY